jgi:hypothetical protein
MFRVEPEVEQCIVVVAGHHGYTPATAAVATTRTTAGYKLLTPKRETAIAAVAGFHFDSYFVDKHVRKMKKGPRGYHRRPLVIFR